MSKHSDAYLGQICSGFAVLTTDYPKYNLVLLIVMYSTLDQLAWLSTNRRKDDSSNRNDFKAWVEKYYLSLIPSERRPTCDELWAARNGVLHMGTASSKDTKKNAVRELYYTVKSHPNPSANYEKFRVVWLDEMAPNIIRAASNFFESIEMGSEDESELDRKLGKMLKFEAE